LISQIDVENRTGKAIDKSELVTVVMLVVTVFGNGTENV
jgi:hypothetical protein